MKHYITIALCTFLSQMCTAQVMMLFSSDSLTGIVSPLDVDSLFYWFAADVGVTDSLGGAIATDEGVGTWNDLSGNGHHLTSAGGNTTRPVYKPTGGAGGRPCLQFDASNDYMEVALSPVMVEPFHVFVLFKQTATAQSSATSTRRLIDGNDGTNRAALSLIYSPSKEIEQISNSTFALASTEAAAHSMNTWYLIEGIYNGSSSQILLDGSSRATGTLSSENSDFLRVGANITLLASQFFGGCICEIIGVSDVLTAAQAASLRNYLNRKYDLY